MAEVITTAGRKEPETVQPESPRRAAIKAVRAVIRNPSSTDAEIEDALEALVELSREQE